MPRERSKERPLVVAHITLGASEQDHDATVRFLGRRYRLLRLGTDGDLATAETLARRWGALADVVAVGGAAEAKAAGSLRGDSGRAAARLARAADGGTVTDGRRLHEVLQEWAVRRVQAEMPGYFSNARTVVLGNSHGRAVSVLREYTANLHFEDPALRLDLQRRLKGYPVLGFASQVGGWPLRQVPSALRDQARVPAEKVSRSLLRRAAAECDVVVAGYDELVAFGFEDLHGKAVITSAVSGARLADLADRDVDLVLDTTPQPFEGLTVDVAVLEAMMRAAVAVTGGDPERLGDDDLLDIIETTDLQPRVLQPHGPRRKSRFAFVIHPLSQKFFAKVEPLATVSKVSPPIVMDVVEKAMAHMPPFVYSHITGITSPTGAEAEGWLITVGGTPKELLAHEPEFTYDKLLAAADMARGMGAQVMGLGAFTKVVGDAGVTVSRKASLPITTGNSYSASGALWAAHEAVDQLGLLERDGAGAIRGKAMVVGATGSIGSVCARLLALASDELWLVSPETAKLLALKEDIEREEPRAVVHAAATPDDHLADMDVIVTATSGAGKRVLDIMAVKPGCVITDVARPLDLSAEDVARRPDVLVVESGEIQLPGEVEMRDIGLPPNVVYACMAETVALALEGRYETFTVGRNIEWERVKEIYALGLRHGMRLATISGVNGVYTPQDVARIRELALQNRAAHRVGA